MYTSDQVTPIVGITSPAVAVAILPNTGGNTLLAVIAVINLVIGAVIIGTTIARFVAKKAHNA